MQKLSLWKNENGTEKKVSIRIFLVLLIILQVGAGVFTAFHKDGMHIDEVYTFGSANNATGLYLFSDQSYLNTWHNADYYMEYMTVQESELFNYKIPFNNIISDNHQPLYFFVVHTMSSLFPNTFSYWFGIVPNIIFHEL